MSVSFLEIYNELLFDMLSDSPPHEQTGTGVVLQNDTNGEVQTKGLTIKPCKNAEEALNCLFEGL